MPSNTTNTTSFPTVGDSAITWSAIIFLIFVAVLLIIAVVLILYFEKLCCFARYRFLKPLMRRFNQPNRSTSSSAISQPAQSLPSKKPDEKKTSSNDTPEYLWIAGHREPISLFHLTPAVAATFMENASRMDLPDDDYTTLVPPLKQLAGTSRKLPLVPSAIENKEADALSATDKSNESGETIITEISRRRSLTTQPGVEHTQSAPSSPILSHSVRNRSSQFRKLIDQTDGETKSTSSDHGSISGNGTSLGSLEIRLKFDAKNSKMWVFVIKATLDAPSHLSKQTLVQIHLTMLPAKRVRYRTRAKPIDNAMFAEEFFCKVSSESMYAQGIRFRLYTNERFKREKLLAEGTVMFASVNLDEDMCKIVPLERAYPSDDSDQGGSRSWSTSSVQSRQNSINRSGGTNGSLLPELEVGLAYDKNQAILVLEIGKGMNYNMSPQGRAPDTYAQITLLNSSGQEMVSNRTTTRRAQHHPVFAERYPLSIQENLLDQITLVITIVNKSSTGKTDRHIGWISFGHGASGNIQVAHWDSMLNAHGETVTRWHALSES